MRVSGARFAFAACGYGRGYFEAGPLLRWIFGPGFSARVCVMRQAPVKKQSRPARSRGRGSAAVVSCARAGVRVCEFSGPFSACFLRKLYRLRLLFIKRVRPLSTRSVLKLSSVSSLKYAGVCIWLLCLLRGFYWCGHVLVIIERAKLCVGFCALYCYGSRWYLYTLPGLYPFGYYDRLPQVAATAI